jgi:hypothetical protein
MEKSAHDKVDELNRLMSGDASDPSPPEPGILAEDKWRSTDQGEASFKDRNEAMDNLAGNIEDALQSDPLPSRPDLGSTTAGTQDRSMGAFAQAMGYDQSPNQTVELTALVAVTAGLAAAAVVGAVGKAIDMVSKVLGGDQESDQQDAGTKPFEPISASDLTEATDRNPGNELANSFEPVTAKDLKSEAAQEPKPQADPQQQTEQSDAQKQNR